MTNCSRAATRHRRCRVIGFMLECGRAGRLPLTQMRIRAVLLHDMGKLVREQPLATRSSRGILSRSEYDM